jgi:hypothetical protein
MVWFGLIVVKLGQKLSETVKGKLSLGARVVREGGRENIFRQVFGMSQGEQMLKASQCYLSTTAGPIAGLLFVSSEKVAFCSERSITISSPDGHFITIPYKVPNSKCLICSNINLFLFFKLSCDLNFFFKYTKRKNENYKEISRDLTYY